MSLTYPLEAHSMRSADMALMCQASKRALLHVGIVQLYICAYSCICTQLYIC